MVAIVMQIIEFNKKKEKRKLQRRWTRRKKVRRGRNSCAGSVNNKKINKSQTTSGIAKTRLLYRRKIKEKSEKEVEQRGWITKYSIIIVE